ncbi:MAG: anti-sigma factor antagonist [Pedosphaera sp.]|nr:anti-sigma factor antagonist [Pedosphaera sp.]
MNTPLAQIGVCAGGEFACVKVQGRANFTSSIDFNTVLIHLREQGCSHFVIELSECALMDSTFLGVLTGFGLKMTQANGAQATRPVELRNPNARITELLENLGVLHLFTTATGNVELPEKLECAPQATAEHSREEVTRSCLEAHETLMGLNPGNAARFKDVAKFLAEELARMKGEKLK